MEKKNNKLFVIIVVCLVAVAVILSVFLLRGCEEENNESNTDVSVNIEISETVSNTDISTEISTDEVSAEESTPEESLPVDHTHEYADTWSSNETDRWYECACGDKSGVTSHTYGDWTVTKESTEETEGSKYHTCSACGYKETVKIPVLSHTHKYGDWKNNATSHWTECECGDKSQLSSHTYGDWVTTKDATCTETGTKKHTCTACGYVETATIPVIAHTYGDWKSNATSHWKECKCGAVSEKASHTYTSVVTDPTEAEKGYTTHTCDKCGYSYKDSYTDPVITTYSEGLRYTVNDDGVTCTITGIGTCTDTDLKIPPEIDGYRVTIIGRKALDNTKITSVTIPDSVTDIGECAFEGCTSLTSVTIPDSVTTIGGHAFCSCRKLKSVYYQGDIEDWLSISLKDYDSNPCGNGANLYFNNKLVTNVIIPDSVTTIGKYAFYRCRSFTSATIGNGVTTIGESAFNKCTSLTNVTIANSVTTIDYSAFSECTKLASITIPDSVTSIGAGAFVYCSSLTSVTIGNSVTMIGWSVFEGCTSLTSVIIPDSVTTIGRSAFQSCTSLTSITIPDSVTEIYENAFADCPKLTDVYYTGSESDWNNINIGSNNSYLTNATIHYNS